MGVTQITLLNYKRNQIFKKWNSVLTKIRLNSSLNKLLDI